MASKPLEEQLAEVAQPPRSARLFRNCSNQALRLPREFEFSATDEVIIYRLGTRLVIEPKRRSWLDLSAAPTVDEAFMAPRPQLLSAKRRVKL